MPLENPCWNAQRVEQLAELWSQFPPLYNSNLAEYKDRNLRRSCIRQISLKLGIDVYEVAAKMKNLRGQYTKERAKGRYRASLNTSAGPGGGEGDLSANGGLGGGEGCSTGAPGEASGGGDGSGGQVLGLSSHPSKWKYLKVLSFLDDFVNHSTSLDGSSRGRSPATNQDADSMLAQGPVYQHLVEEAHKLAAATGTHRVRPSPDGLVPPPIHHSASLRFPPPPPMPTAPSTVGARFTLASAAGLTCPQLSSEPPLTSSGGQPRPQRGTPLGSTGVQPTHLPPVVSAELASLGHTPPTVSPGGGPLPPPGAVGSSVVHHPPTPQYPPVAHQPPVVSATSQRSPHRVSSANLIRRGATYSNSVRRARIHHHNGTAVLSSGVTRSHAGRAVNSMAVNCVTPSRKRALSPSLVAAASRQQFTKRRATRSFEDHLDTFSRYVASELRFVTDEASFRWAKTEIQRVLLEAQERCPVEVDQEVSPVPRHGGVEHRGGDLGRGPAGSMVATPHPLSPVAAHGESSTGPPLRSGGEYASGGEHATEGRKSAGAVDRVAALLHSRGNRGIHGGLAPPTSTSSVTGSLLYSLKNRRAHRPRGRPHRHPPSFVGLSEPAATGTQGGEDTTHLEDDHMNGDTGEEYATVHHMNGDADSGAGDHGAEHLQEDRAGHSGQAGEQQYLGDMSSGMIEGQQYDSDMPTGVTEELPVFELEDVKPYVGDLEMSSGVALQGGGEIVHPRPLSQSSEGGEGDGERTEGESGGLSSADAALLLSATADPVGGTECMDTGELPPSDASPPASSEDGSADGM